MPAIDPTPKLLLVSFGLCALAVAGASGMRLQTAKRWWQAEHVLIRAITAEPAGAGADDGAGIEVECREGDWPSLVAKFAPIRSVKCFDDAITPEARGTRCRAFFKDDSCISADVFGDEKQWRIRTAGRLYRPCVP